MMKLYRYRRTRQGFTAEVLEMGQWQVTKDFPADAKLFGNDRHYYYATKLPTIDDQLKDLRDRLAALEDR